MNLNRLLVVVNPSGGMKRGLNVLERVKPIFADAGIELGIEITKHPGHAAMIARSLDLQDWDGLCVVGGDGTVHEVVDGLMQQVESAKIPLGIIPAGTGNTLAHHLQCDDPLEAARTIVIGRTQPLDVIRVTLTDRIVHCVDLVGWGAVADINANAERWRFLGPSRYAAAALWQIVRAKRRQATFTLDGQTLDDEFLFIIACNPKFTGSGMKLTPYAELGDGLIDVVVVRRATRWEMLKLFTRVFDGSHLTLKFVEYHQVRSFSIESRTHDRMNLDGEMKGHTPVSAEVLPAALALFA
jgi:YegS/Rv2252/BmrU family lipid kinase